MNPFANKDLLNCCFNAADPESSGSSTKQVDFSISHLWLPRADDRDKKFVSLFKD